MPINLHPSLTVAYAFRYSFGIVANMVVFAVLWLLFSLSSGAELGPKDDIWFRVCFIY